MSRSADLAVVMAVPHAHRIGGYERQAFRLAGALRAAGLEARVATHRLPSALRPPRGAEGVPVDTLPIGAGRGLGATLACAAYLVGQRRRRRRLVLHAHALADFSLVMMHAARRVGLPAIVKIATAGDIDAFCSGRDGRKRPWPLGPRFRDILFAADAIVTLNERSADEARRHGPPGPSRVLSFTNVADVDGVGEPAGDPGSGRSAGGSSVGLAEALDAARAGGRRVALMINRLERRKNTARLVAAWNALPAGLRAKWRLLVIGGGEEDAAVRAGAHAAGDGSVTLLGECVDPESALEAADLFILASEREGNPNGLLEAIARGVPVLVTDVAGVGDCLPATAAGSVFSLGDPRDLETAGRERLRACLETLSSRPRGDAPASRAAAAPLLSLTRAFFCPAAMARTYRELYEEVLAGRGR